MTVLRDSIVILYVFLTLPNVGCASGNKEIIASQGDQEVADSYPEIVSLSLQKIILAINRGEVVSVEIVKRNYMSTSPFSIKREEVDSVAAQICSIKLKINDARRFSNLLGSIHLRRDAISTDTFWRVSFVDDKKTVISSMFLGRRYPKYNNVMVETNDGIFNDEGVTEKWLNENVEFADCSLKN